jgi:hypothetical protein
MARVTYGALVVDLAGSIGGTTFQKNSSGAIARSRAYTPVNPSVLQSDRQLALCRFVALWPSLTVIQKTAWNDLAAAHLKINDWGVSSRVSGYQWFIAYNLNGYTQGYPAYLVPEAYYLVPPMEYFTLSANASKFDIDFHPTGNSAGTWTGVYATAPLRQSSIKLRKSTFLIDLIHISTETVVHIMDSYSNYFNITWADFYNSANATIVIRLKNFAEDTGYASPFTSNLITIG